MNTVIFITREDYNLAGGRIRCYNFARELKECGLNTKVLSFADTLGAKSGKTENELNILDKLRYNIKAINKLRKESNAVFFLNRLNYHSLAPWVLSILKGNKIIFDLDDWEIRENSKYYFRFWPSSKAEFLTRKLAKRAFVCFGASKFLTNYLSRYNKKTYYLPSAVDIEKFEISEKEKNNNKIIFSWIGTMHRKHDIENIEFIISCFLTLRDKYNNIFLEIVGDGIYRNLLSESEVRKKNISFKNWLHPDKIPGYLSNIDIGLLPLIQNTKFNRAKSPVKLFEYMAMGKPVIASNIGESKYIIEDGKNGLLAKDREEFISKMQTLINNRILAYNIGRNAADTIQKKYSLDSLAKKIKNKLLNATNKDSP